MVSSWLPTCVSSCDAAAGPTPRSSASTFARPKSRSFTCPRGLTNTFAGWYHRVALAHRDSTNLAAFEVTVDAKSGWQEQHPQHTTVAFNGALASAQSLTQTTLNNARFCFLWGLNLENDPAEIAAWFASYRSVAEVADPVTDHDGVEIPGATPFFLPSSEVVELSNFQCAAVGNELAIVFHEFSDFSPNIRFVRVIYD